MGSVAILEGERGDLGVGSGLGSWFGSPWGSEPASRFFFLEKRPLFDFEDIIGTKGQRGKLRDLELANLANATGL